MTRLEEVEASIKWIMSAGMTGGAITPNMRDLCRTLAAEVDARDEVITRLLEMLLPGVAPPHDPCGCVECKRHEINEGRYRRALEIAGRTE